MFRRPVYSLANKTMFSTASAPVARKRILPAQLPTSKSSMISFAARERYSVVKPSQM
jgi:hypothetical protein